MPDFSDTPRARSRQKAAQHAQRARRARSTDPPGGSDDPRHLAALAACEEAQAALDAARLLVEDDPDRFGVLAEAYERRAAAWAELAEALPVGMPGVLHGAVRRVGVRCAAGDGLPPVGGRARVGETR